LIEAGAKVDVPNKSGETPLCFAALNGNLKLVAELIVDGADVNNSHNESATPLCYAAQNGHLEVVSALLKYGAVIDKVDKKGLTPLVLAAKNDRIAIVMNLIKRGADVNKVSFDDWSLLKWAAENGYVYIVLMLIQAGIDVNKIHEDGWTLLLWAAKTGHRDIVSKILVRGVDCEKVTKECGSPLLWPAINGHADVVSRLIKAGFDVNVIDKHGFTPLMYAAQNGRFKVAWMLLDAGAEADKSGSKYGDTALCYAAIDGNLELVNILLGAGADVNGPLKDSLTPLYYAARNGYLDIVLTLLEAGADVEKTNKDSQTPLNIAAKNGNTEVVLQLLKAGAKGDDKVYDYLFDELFQYILRDYWVDCKLLKKLLKTNNQALFDHMYQKVLDIIKGLSQKRNDKSAFAFMQLLWACILNQPIDIIDDILSNADSHLFETDFSVTPVYYAAMHGNAGTVMKLLESGARFDKPSTANFRQHEVASIIGLHSFSHIYVKNSQKPFYTALNLDYVSPLQVAIERGHIDVILQLIKAGVDVNEVDGWDSTPLIHAVRCGHLDIVSKLLELGADVSKGDKKGRTPLMIAKKKGFDDIYSMLKKAYKSNFVKQIILEKLNPYISPPEDMYNLNNQSGWIWYFFPSAREHHYGKQASELQILLKDSSVTLEALSEKCIELMSTNKHETEEFYSILQFAKNSLEKANPNLRASIDTGSLNMS
jgi:ankyrin repeat protein